MDLGTMQTKLSNGKYSSMEGFAADYRLMMRNCRAFNPPMTYPTDCADALDKMFDKEWSRASEKKMSFPEKRSLQNVLAKLVQDPLYVPFPVLVCPSADELPQLVGVPRACGPNRTWDPDVLRHHPEAGRT
jgi:transcription initiation factor TFIID subunit 2